MTMQMPVRLANESDADFIARLTAFAAAAAANQKKAAAPRKLTVKVAKSGGISVYGTQARYPVTQYADAWTRIGREVFGLNDEQIAASPMGKFIEANKSHLSFKTVEETVAAEETKA